AVSSAPRFAPSNWNWTPITATLSDAVAETVRLAPATVAPLAGAVIDTVGGVPSTLFTVTLTAADVVELPAASRATAVSMRSPMPRRRRWRPKRPRRPPEPSPRQPAASYRAR